jgi:hypothetical protein
LFGLLASPRIENIAAAITPSDPSSQNFVDALRMMSRSRLFSAHVPAMPRWSIHATPQAEQADAANRRWRVLVVRKGFWFFIVLGRR